MASNSMKMSGSIEEKYLPPPALGQHNDEMLKGLLGYSEATMAELRRIKVAHAAQLAEHLQKLL